MSTQHGPFVITDLPQGWSVTWPGFESVLINNTIKIRRLLTMLFEDLKLDRAQLGVSLNNGDFETYHIDSILWYSNSDDARDYLVQHILSHYVTVGVKFDHEAQARQFLSMLEKLYIWRMLGGTWT